MAKGRIIRDGNLNIPRYKKTIDVEYRSGSPLDKAIRKQMKEEMLGLVDKDSVCRNDDNTVCIRLIKNGQPFMKKIPPFKRDYTKGINLHCNDDTLIVDEYLENIYNYSYFLGDYCGEYQNIRKVNITEPTIYIGIKAFSGCDKITDVTIGDSVELIDGGAFYGCKSLENVVLPDKDIHISGSAFDRTPWLKKLLSQNGAFIKNGLLIRASNSQQFTITKDIVDISDSAFRNNSRLRSIKFDSDIEFIPNSCFRGCSKLEDIKIPDSVKVIGCFAFYNNKSLESITIPDGVEAIDHKTFCKCESLTAEGIKLPDSIRMIGSMAFSDTSFKYFKAPKNLRYIANDAFYGNECLREVWLPEGCLIYDGVKKIESCGYGNEYYLDRDYDSGDTTYEPTNIASEQQFISEWNYPDIKYYKP